MEKRILRESASVPPHKIKADKTLKHCSQRSSINPDEQITNCAFWKLGLIEGLINSNENEVRGVRVQTGNRHVMEIPVKKVFTMELKAMTDDSSIKWKGKTLQRPTRMAKTVANERIAINDQLHKELD